MKKLLITLSLICGVVLLGFCNAQTLEHGIYSKAGGTYNNPLSIQGISGYITCINGANNDSFNHARWTFDSTKVNDYSQMNAFTNLTGTVNRNTFCFEGDYTLYLKPESAGYGTIEYYISKILLEEKICPTCPTCQECEEQYTSLECQTEYGLIPISSVDHEYCESNDLCTLCDTPINTGDIQRSALFINTIQYPGGPIINLDLGDNLDYTYSTGNASVDITVGGYEIDEEYLNGVIDSQTYTPTKEDFTKVFSLFGSYGGLLVVCLFVILVFYFVKKLIK